jgi:hypothetical protein
VTRHRSSARDLLLRVRFSCAPITSRSFVLSCRRQRRRLIRYTMSVTRRSNVSMGKLNFSLLCSLLCYDHYDHRNYIQFAFVMSILTRCIFCAHLHTRAATRLITKWPQLTRANGCKPSTQRFCETDGQKQPCRRVLIFMRTRRRQTEGRSSMCNRRECQKFKLRFEVIE